MPAPSCTVSFYLSQFAPFSSKIFFFTMDASLLDDLIAKNKPFRIETASGRVLEVPHRDFVSFSPKKTVTNTLRSFLF